MKRIHAIGLAVGVVLAALPWVVSCGAGGGHATLRFTPDHHVSVAVGGAVNLTATLENPAPGTGGRTWTWESGNTGIATVSYTSQNANDNTATVNGVAPGQVNITAIVAYFDDDGSAQTSNTILVTVVSVP